MNNNLLYELKDGKGYLKEFIIPDMKIIYEGEYLNGEKNGKGKEYYGNGDLKSEGEYFNGKKWNIKVYDKEKSTICEIKEGKGYNECGKLAFEGEFLNAHEYGKEKKKNLFILVN